MVPLRYRPEWAADRPPAGYPTVGGNVRLAAWARRYRSPTGGGGDLAPSLRGGLIDLALGTVDGVCV